MSRCFVDGRAAAQVLRPWRDEELRLGRLQLNVGQPATLLPVHEVGKPRVQIVLRRDSRDRVGTG